MRLDERNGRLQGLFGFCLVFDDDLLTVLVGNLKVQVGLHVRRGPENQPHDKSDGDLADNLVFPLKPLLVVLEDLDEIVHSAEETQPESRADHQQEIDVAQPAQQEDGNQEGNDDDDAAH